jgi:hypothetical protein
MHLLTVTCSSTIFGLIQISKIDQLLVGCHIIPLIACKICLCKLEYKKQSIRDYNNIVYDLSVKLNSCGFYVQDMEHT